MMASQEDIDKQQQILAAHRATLATLLAQQATFTSAYAPPQLVAGIAEARSGIAQCKATLRSWGVAVEEHPDDEDALPLTTPDAQAQQHARDRALLDYMGRVQGQEPNQATNVEEADISQALHLTPTRVRASLTRLKRAGAIDLVDSHDGMSAWITDEGWELLDQVGAD